jgi:hypothetical protein
MYARNREFGSKARGLSAVRTLAVSIDDGHTRQNVTGEGHEALVSPAVDVNSISL